MKKLFIFIFLITGNCFSFAQNKIDSLLSQIKTDKEDTNKVKHLHKVANEYINIGEYGSALQYGRQELALAQNINFKKGEAKAYTCIGIIYYNQGNYPEALKNHFASLKIREEIKDKLGIAYCYGNIGNVYQNEGDYPEALKTFFASLKIMQEVKNKQGIADSYNNIGGIYSYQGNGPKALKTFFASLKIREEIGDKTGIAASYNNIGNIYMYQGNYQEAIKNHFASLKIKEEMGDKEGIATSFINLGSIYTKLNKTKESETYLNKALALSLEIGSKEDLKFSYQDLIALDSTMGNYKAAFEHHKLFITYRDSLNNEETKRKSLQSAMQYEFEKKEIATRAEQDKLDVASMQEKNKQQIIIYAVAGILLLVIIFSSLLYKRFRLTNKQKEIIELKSKETEEQKKIIEEKHKEITDSINYAERIQRSFIATKEILDENLNNYFVLFKPKDVVSGDFYWASKLVNGNFALVTADSTGHGVPGAIMSLLNITSIEKAIEQHVQPADILNVTRKIIIARLKKDGSPQGGKDGMDASLTVYDFKNKKLIVAAANNPVWIVRASTDSTTVESIEIKPDKMPVGKHDLQDVSFTQQEIELKSGDVVYTLTDGFPDQFGGKKGKKFMSKKLKELLSANAHLPMQEQKELLELTLKNWIGNLEQIDDVTLIGIKI